MVKYHRFEGESEDELIYRVCSDKEFIGSWKDVADVLNEILGYSYSESKYRKCFQYFNKMFDANKKKLVGNEQFEEINEKIRELERKKIQFRDERNAWNKQNYVAARVEQKLDYLEEALTSIGKIEFGEYVKSNNLSIRKSDNDMLVMLTDWHIGECFDNKWGKFNTDIAKERIGILINEIKELKELHNCVNCFVVLQGDLISGNIHKSVQVTNRENVIDQVKIATELLTNFLGEISDTFENIYVDDVVGNHSRIDKKEDAINDERLDSLVSWGAKFALSNRKNIYFNSESIDSSITSLNIRDKYYVFVHGDYDKFNKSGISSLCMYLKGIPYAVCMGHMHSCAVDETNGIKMIRGGSLCGSGDEFTIKKRLSGKPSQMVCICNKKGVKAYCPIEFDN